MTDFQKYLDEVTRWQKVETIQLHAITCKPPITAQWLFVEIAKRRGWQRKTRKVQVRQGKPGRFRKLNGRGDGGRSENLEHSATRL